MGFTIQGSEHGRAVPVLLCDVCGEKILELDLGIVVFNFPINPDIAIKPVFIHKGACDDERELKEGKRRQWMDLSDYLPWLMWNHNWGKKIVRKQPKGAPEYGRLDEIRVRVRHPFL